MAELARRAVDAVRSISGVGVQSESGSGRDYYQPSNSASTCPPGRLAVEMKSRVSVGLAVRARGLDVGFQPCR
jgi:hypothetical protein